MNPEDEIEFSREEIEALGRMVAEWIYEGFTTPPYEDAYYAVFEKLDAVGVLDLHDWNRDKIKRPK